MASQPPEISERPEFHYESEGTVAKMKRKTKDSPMMTLGLAGCAIVAGYGFYKYKNRGQMSTSNYLMQLRVTAQGVVIGALTLGVMKSLYDHFTKNGSDSS